jgi:hypothetical protein
MEKGGLDLPMDNREYQGKVGVYDKFTSMGLRNRDD